MRKSLSLLLIMSALAIAVMGCATKGDIEKMRVQEQQTNLKADQALKASQEANEAATKAAEAVKAADERAKVAEERAKMAEERADQSNAAFQRSMQK